MEGLPKIRFLYVAFCVSGPARVDLPGAVVEDEISDRDSPGAGSLSTPSPPQVAPSLKIEHCYLNN